MTKISFCVIVEGDEKLDDLKRLMESTKDVFDSVHITTNYEPVDKVRAWCKKKRYDFTYLKWDDNFSEQRNFNFSRVPDDTDFICWADSDDVILNAPRLREIADLAKQNGHDAVFFTYWYGCKFDGEASEENFVEVEIQQKRERLLKKDSIVWKKRLHESPVPIDGVNFVHTKVEYSEENPIVWMHLGADRDQTEDGIVKRNIRNRRILELDLAEERAEGEADPRTLLYLMKIYAEQREDGDILRKCVDMGREYLLKSGWDEERAVCYKLMSSCMGTLGNHEEARDLLMNALTEYPYEPLLYLYLARTYRNLENWAAMKHWMKVGMSMRLEESRSQMDNILELKVLSAELMLEYAINADKNVRKMWEAAKLLNKVNPTKNNQYNEDMFFDRKELDIACESVHKLLNYYDEIGKIELIPSTIEGLAPEIKEVPFIKKMYNKYREPKVWEADEICYFANFGKEHLEKWSPESLKTGIGGSETAVIQLSKEWTKLGYRVTVYGDPKEAGKYDGVVYLPFHMFNKRDKFNVFIQWRDNALAGKINAKKFYIDLHDVWFPQSFKVKMDSIDKIVVKSEYQRDLGDGVSKDKFLVISNGI